MNEIEELFAPMRETHMKDDERARMRASLMSFMREHPAQPSAWARAWYRFIEVRSALQLHPAVVALVLVLCVGTGTSYAAELALPGDTLYPIKTHFNEKALGVLAVSHAAQAEWSAQLADRRLSEAEELIAEGRLTPIAAASIQVGLDEATKNFDDSVSKIATAENVTDASDAQSDLQASLQAHAHVLAALQTPTSSDTNDVTQLLQSVKTSAKGVALARTESQKLVGNGPSEKVRAAITAKKQDAEAAVQTLHALATAAGTNFGATTSDEVNTGAMRAAERVTIGSKKLDAGDFSGALGAFQAAIRAAKETKVSLDAAKNFKGKLHSHVSENSEKGEAGAKAMMLNAAAPMTMQATIAADAAASTSRSIEHENENDDSSDDSINVNIHF